MSRRFSFLLGATLLLSGCGNDVPTSAPVPAEVIENVAVLRPQKEKETVPQRLGILADADVPSKFRIAPYCRFELQGQPALIVVAGEALARIDGRPVRLAIQGPVGPTGGFFTGKGVTVSIGRLGQYDAQAEDYVPGWPAGVSVGGQPDRPLQKLEGVWRCVRQGAAR